MKKHYLVDTNVIIDMLLASNPTEEVRFLLPML